MIYKTPTAGSGAGGLPAVELDFANNVVISAGSSSTSSAVSAGLYRVVGTVKFHLLAGSSPTADLNDAPFGANIPEYHYFSNDTTVAVIKQSGEVDGKVVLTPAATVG